jgi:hypothetical protein
MRKTRTGPIPVLVAAALAAAAASARAADSVDLQLRGKDKVSGTLRPVTDTECYVCDLPRGALLSVALKGAGKPFATVGLALRLGGVDVGGAPIETSTKGATIKSYAIEASGRYTVCVVAAGDVDGDYSASVSWKPRSSWVGTGGPLDPEATDSFSFAAPAGATATIDVLPAPDSLFDGQISGITGPVGFDPMGAAGTHAVIPVCPVTGDYSVKFKNAGVAAGAWLVRVKLKLPKVSKGKVDIRDRALAGAFGDHTVYGRIVGEEGGLVLVGDESGGALAGASVSVPADALGAPTVITISATTTVHPEGGAYPAGPAVEFGPEGTTFTENATLSLPYDPAYFPGGTETLEVYVRDAEGNVTLVPGPYTVDEVNHLVSFPVSHFSSYQAAATGTRPFVGDFYVAELAHEVSGGFEAKFGFGLHRLFVSGPRADVSLSTAWIAWHNYGVEGSDAYVETFGQFQQFDISTPDDATVVLDDKQNPGQGATFTRGTSDDVLVGRGQTLLALRQARTSPTFGSVTGRWHVFHLTAAGKTQNSGGPSSGEIEIFGETGEVTLRPDGTVGTDGFRVLEARTGFPSGTWEFSSGGSPPSGITWGIGDGIVFVSPPEGDGTPFQLYAALDGDVLIGQPFTSGQTDGQTELFVFVRASAKQTLAAFAGLYSVAGQELLFEDRPNPPGQGLTFQDYSLTSTVTGAGNTSIAGAMNISGHDGNGNPVSSTDVPVSGDTGRLTLEADGGFTLPHGIRGAVTPRGDFAIQVRFDEGSFSMYFSTPAFSATKR